MDKISCKIVQLFKSLVCFFYYLLAFYGLCLLMYWFLDSEPPSKTVFSKANKSVVLPGEVIVFEQHIQKFRYCPGKVQRFIRGDCGAFDIPTIDAALREGNHVVKIPVKIPDTFQSGSCYMFSIHTFICNPLDPILNRRVFVSDPIPFYVGQTP